LEQISLTEPGQLELYRAGAVNAVMDILNTMSYPDTEVVAGKILANMASSQDTCREAMSFCVPQVTTVLQEQTCSAELIVELLRFIRNMSSMGSAAVGITLAAPTTITALVEAMRR